MELSRSAQPNISPPLDSPATDMSAPMDEDVSEKETEELPKDPVPESGPLSEIQEVAHWADDPIPISEHFLVS